MFIPIFIANLISSIRGENKRKEDLFNSFKDSSNSLSAISKAKDAGIITPEEAQSRSEVINMGAKILKGMPEVNQKTGKPFSHIESVKWLHSIIRKIALEAKKNGIEDSELSNFYNNKIRELQKENK